MQNDWQQRVDQVWADADNLTEDELVAAIDRVAAERPENDALALFERGGARDSTGRPDLAEPLYREAMAAGLPDDERAQCTIQLASSLRNLGRPEESLVLLRAEFDGKPDHPYAGAAAATTALVLTSLGRPVEGVSLLIHALVPTMPRYQRSMSAYADALAEEHGPTVSA